MIWLFAQATVPNISTAERVWWIVLWAALSILSLLLAVLLWTRWGDVNSLRKCMVFSLLAHLLMASYATSIKVVSQTFAPQEDSVQLTSIDASHAELQELQEQPSAPPAPWLQFNAEQALPPAVPDLERTPSAEKTGQIDRDPLLAPTVEPLASLSDWPISPVESRPPAEAATLSEADLPSQEMGQTAASQADAAEFDLPEMAPPKDITTRPDHFSSAENKEPSAGTVLPNMLGQSQVSAPELDLTEAAPERTQSPAPAIAVDDMQEHEPGNISGGSEQTAEPTTDLGFGPEPPRMAKKPLVPLQNQRNPANPVTGDHGNLAEAVPALMNAGTSPSRATPDVYRLRTAENRLEQIRSLGGSEQTEAAVLAALKWLAANQQADGSWNAAQHEGGQEWQTLGTDRLHAGENAQTGITGLALLAFLAAGHTHERGEFSSNVAAGIDYLIRQQGRDGNLAGRATKYEFMYCHGIASLALSECCALSQDDALAPYVSRAVDYTLSAQNPNTGGWRYKPGDMGDTSQLGWQFMALHSAELCGVPVPRRATAGVSRFLESVASGPHGSHCAYRPGERPTATMTAEAMFCRQIMHDASLDPAIDAAAEVLRRELPDKRRTNFYYWYYGTLGMFQQQDAQWDAWNAALQNALLETQRTAGVQAGSWDPDPVWGGYGGRVYSTALGSLCLEVYYRYLPIVAETASREPRPPLRRE